MMYITHDLRVLSGRAGLAAWVDDALSYQRGLVPVLDFGLDLESIFQSRDSAAALARQIQDILSVHPDIHSAVMSVTQDDSCLTCIIDISSVYGDFQTDFALKLPENR